MSVIEKPRKAPSRPVWLDEKNDKPTRYNVYRADVREAMNFSRTPYYMEDYLRRKGYITDFTGRHWKIRLPQYEHFTRLDTLDERWTPENIRLGRYASFGNRRAYISYPPQMPQEPSDWFRPFHKTSHIYKLVAKTVQPVEGESPLLQLNIVFSFHYDPPLRFCNYCSKRHGWNRICGKRNHREKPVRGFLGDFPCHCYAA